MKFALSEKRAALLFTEGSTELAVKFNEAKAAGLNYVLWTDPGRGEARLSCTKRDHWAFMLEGHGQVFDELLRLARIVHVDEAVIEVLCIGTLREFVNRTGLMRPDGSFLIGSLRMETYPACSVLFVPDGERGGFFLEKQL